MTDKFIEELNILKEKFIQDVASICIRYGLDLIPLSFDEIYKFWNPALNKLINKQFRRKIERKVKRLKKKLNPFWRWIRKRFS